METLGVTMNKIAGISPSHGEYRIHCQISIHCFQSHQDPCVCHLHLLLLQSLIYYICLSSISAQILIAVLLPFAIIVGFADETF
jgi:hypothetical protein